MFFAKLALELAVLAALYFLLQKSIVRIFPAFRKRFSQKNELQYHKEKRTFSLVFFILGGLFSCINFWLIFGVFSIVHHLGDFKSVMVVHQASLVLPALITGFYAASGLVKSVYVLLFGEDEFIFYGHLISHKKSYQKIIGKAASTLALIPAFLLLSFQFNIYLKTDGQKIYSKKWGESEQVFPISEIQQMNLNGTHDLDIYLADGQRVSTAEFSGNINQFMDEISR